MSSRTGNTFVACDPEKCVGCRICEYVCSMEKDNAFNPLRSRIRVIRIYPDINLAITCRRCQDAPCVAACPRDALTQSKETGMIIVDEEECNGCGWCIEACDFGAVTLDPEQKVVKICNLCSDREDEQPQCIEWCPEEALSLASRDTLAQKARLGITEKLFKAALEEETS